jgi:hypothetical protein
MLDKYVKDFNGVFVIGAIDHLFAVGTGEKQHSNSTPFLQLFKLADQFVKLFDDFLVVSFNILAS